jgi:hypothetical protein
VSVTHSPLPSSQYTVPGMSCTGLPSSRPALTVCEAGRALGTGMGIPFVVIVWFIGFIVLGLIWLMSRPKGHAVV